MTDDHIDERTDILAEDIQRSIYRAKERNYKWDGVFQSRGAAYTNLW